ncbi:F-box/kelch-repeat protein At3g06240-like [Malania oleifera]|uniref:F-box/kelch-repeat protein At3g06240-like n=1 Tax=Malania oleifera TaxID=397392 RepID=UPI0025AE10C4|nr:F-box/kelch-repeat protein At3g06240-like [Malania oleifera]
MATNYLPDDVLIEVLVKLPGKSALRFKCVSKWWCSLVKSRGFISRHAVLNKNGGILVSHGAAIFSMLSEDTLNVYKTLDLRPFFQDCVDKIQSKIAGHHNGIICLFNHRGDILLWNPTTRERRSLPLPKTIDMSIDDEICEMVFGFDSNADDCKAMVKMRTWKNGDIYQTFLYSLRTDTWKEMTHQYDLQQVGLNTSTREIYANGMFFWTVTEDEDMESDVIVSFDISSEVFQKIPLPDVCLTLARWKHKRILAVLNESMALLLQNTRKCPLDFNMQIDIWVMREFGVKESWTKQFTLNLQHLSLVEVFGGIPDVHKFLKTGELLLTSSCGKVLALLNPITQELRKLQGHGRIVGIVPYKDSLIPIQGGIEPKRRVLYSNKTIENIIWPLCT